MTLMGKRSGDIENIAMSLADTRKLTVGALVSLSTAGDEFADRVLDLFPSDAEGKWHWPSEDR
jgi:hypothetical protein